jgi:hypothetical protein
VLDSRVEAAAATASGGAAKRLSGRDRYHTSGAVARFAIDELGFSDDEPIFASGGTYPDALSGGPLAGTRMQALLLTGADRCWNGTASAVSGMSEPTQLWILGGPAAISPGGIASLQAAY